jgi:alpha-tubulin suppressor-like RCC1 family protein
MFAALGRGPAGGVAARNSVPELVLDEAGSAPLAAVVQVASSGQHVCALTQAGEVLCWGLNTSGQIGQGSSLEQSYDLPHKVLGVGGEGTLSNVLSVGVGLGFSCAVRQQGDVVCWGLVVERFEPEYQLVASPVPAVLDSPLAP